MQNQILTLGTTGISLILPQIWGLNRDILLLLYNNYYSMYFQNYNCIFKSKLHIRQNYSVSIMHRTLTTDLSTTILTYISIVSTIQCTAAAYNNVKLINNDIVSDFLFDAVIHKY